MNKFALIGIFSLIAASASAQTTAPSAAPPPAMQTAPMAGANSFTEEQAKSHIEKMGYTDVTELKKDEKGIWHGHAMKGGQKVPVSLDYKGNVVAK